MSKYPDDIQTFEATFDMPPCYYCKHLIETGKQFDNDGWQCKAFPTGIPYGIWKRYENHDEIKPGQKGKFLYESKEYEDKDGKKVTVSFEGKYVPVKK